MLPISVGILSWDSHEVLEETLETYYNNGFFKLVSDVTILFQEVTPEDKALAKKYGLKFIGLDNNIGIGKAMQILAEQAKEEYFLFLENDWQIIENYKTTKRRLFAALDLLEEGYKVVRLRSRQKYGYPLHSEIYKGNELKHYDSNIGLMSPHLFECIHWTKDPDLQFPNQISKHKYHYVTTSRWSSWTNNPCLLKTEFLLDIIEPFTNDLLLEPSISKWWVNQNYGIAWGEGLFKHVDFKKYPEIDRFDWGMNEQYLVNIINQEIFVDKIYEKFRNVSEGDVVVDIGANVGAFTYSILKSKPSKVICVEPSNNLIHTLRKNVKNKGVEIQIENSAIQNKTELNAKITPNVDFVYMNDGVTFNTITFSDLLWKYKLKSIDFLKIDCESGEYSVFNDENYEFLTTNVRHISGEWHIWGFENAIEKFIDFRDKYLVNYTNFKVFDRNDVEVTDMIFNYEFLKQYSENLTHSAQFIIYIDN
jgi:FkbM family methyltransferase